MNEPEGSVLIAEDSEPCYDTSNLAGTGAGWAGTGVSMRDILRFTNQLADAIHGTDPKALVTIGTWSEWTITDVSSGNDGDTPRNYYKDECLIKAGGLANGTLDFVQVHSYAWAGEYSAASPFSVNRAYYSDVTKPILIGEFASVYCGSSMNISAFAESVPSSHVNGCSVEQHYSWGVAQGYAGIWDWALIGGDGVDNMALCNASMGTVAAEMAVRAVVLEGEAPPDTCSCSDVPPDDEYSCEEQASWGKCDEDFMAGFCCKSCFACADCT